MRRGVTQQICELTFGCSNWLFRRWQALEVVPAVFRRRSLCSGMIAVYFASKMFLPEGGTHLDAIYLTLLFSPNWHFLQRHWSGRTDLSISRTTNDLKFKVEEMKYLDFSLSDTLTKCCSLYCSKVVDELSLS
jgi:hypothetical protein